MRSSTEPRRPVGERSASPSGLRGHGPQLLVLSLLVGAGAACFAVAFRWLITTFTRLFSGYADYAAHPGAGHGRLAVLGPWFVVITPVLAGLLYGPLVHAFAREARGHGVPEVMDAVARRGGRIPPQVAGVKALASALCIGGGGSVGREGPIVQIGAALGSTVGRIARLPTSRLRVLVACGAAGGIAATFNAPLAGVFFSLELILADFVAEAFGMVVVSAVTAGALGRAMLGDDPFLRLPGFAVEHAEQYLLFAGLGVCAGVVGVAFIRVLYTIEDLCDAVWRGPEWLRPAVGGVALGGVLLVLPQMYGVGYPVLGDAVVGRYGVAFLLVLLAGKMVATSLTIGIGGSGGVFAPSLFVGGMLGAAFGTVASNMWPGAAGPSGAYALVGMGAVFASCSRAPITAVVILFELTGQYDIILPLMLAVVLATGVSHRTSRDTIYSAKLWRRGVDLGRRETVDVDRVTVDEVMAPLPPPLDAAIPLAEAAVALAAAPSGVLPVTGGAHGAVRLIGARTVAEALVAGVAGTTTVGTIASVAGVLRADHLVEDAVTILDASSDGALPVLAPHEDRAVGWLDHRTLLGALHAHEPRARAAE